VDRAGTALRACGRRGRRGTPPFCASAPDDHATGDPVSRVPRRVGPLVILLLVDHERAAVAVEERGPPVAEHDAVGRDVIARVPVLAGVEVRQVTGVWALGRLKPVLARVWVEVVAGARELRRIAAADRVDVDTVPSRTEAPGLHDNADPAGLLGQGGGADGLPARVPQLGRRARARTRRFTAHHRAPGENQTYAQHERWTHGCLFASWRPHLHHSAGSAGASAADAATFSFILSWLEGGPKGWTFHYRPKHPPLSAELEAALVFLGLRPFGSCPEFDFEPCYSRFAPFEIRSDSVWDSNAQYVHAHFDAHAGKFSKGIELLLDAQTAVEVFGLRSLSLPASAEQRSIAEIERRVLVPRGRARRPNKTLRFDVAISFAGTERPLAEQLAAAAQQAGFDVFYDAFYPEELWGKDLVVFFDEIYRKAARFCVMLVSKEYVERQWTNHERRSAQARALQERGGEYILPVKIDGTELPGMPPTIGYVSLAELGVERIAELLVRKLQAP
jgi:TIR domain